MPKLKVGDLVKRCKLHEDAYWLEQSGTSIDQVLKVSFVSTHSLGFEGMDTLWAYKYFDKVEPEIAPVDSHPTGKTPSDFLRQAADTLDERGKQYDSTGSERSMEKTVTIFNTLTGNSLTTAEGWQFMKVLKDVRLWSNTDVVHVDSIVDNLGYTALLAEETISLGGKLKEAKD